MLLKRKYNLCFILSLLQWIYRVMQASLHYAVLYIYRYAKSRNLYLYSALGYKIVYRDLADAGQSCRQKGQMKFYPE